MSIHTAYRLIRRHGSKAAAIQAVRDAALNCVDDRDRRRLMAAIDTIRKTPRHYCA